MVVMGMVGIENLTDRDIHGAIVQYVAYNSSGHDIDMSSASDHMRY